MIIIILQEVVQNHKKPL